MNKINRKTFAKTNGYLYLQFTWRLDGVSSSDEDIEEKNCSTLL